MKYTFLVVLILTSIISRSQTVENRIVVIGESSIEIPADQIVFNISLIFKDSNNIQAAFERHKISETKLLNYLKELNVLNKNIHYSLINVGKMVDYQSNDRTVIYGTNQTISVKIEDVNKSTDFMLKLITAGFTEIITSFKSSKENEFHDKLIEKAIEVAKKKALVMALASKRKLTRILKVSDTDDTDPNFGFFESMAMAADVGYGGQIVEIPQTITKSYRVKVVFGLQ